MKFEEKSMIIVIMTVISKKKTIFSFNLIQFNVSILLIVK